MASQNSFGAHVSACGWGDLKAVLRPSRDEVLYVSPTTHDSLVELDDALKELAINHQRKFDIVEMPYSAASFMKKLPKNRAFPILRSTEIAGWRRNPWR